MTPKRQIMLQIERAFAELSILHTLLKAQIHDDDRKQIDTIINGIRHDLGQAEMELNDVIHDVQAAIDRI